MSRHLEFANFLCHFGRDKVMIDYLTEIVVPAFTDDTFDSDSRKRNAYKLSLL